MPPSHPASPGAPGPGRLPDAPPTVTVVGLGRVERTPDLAALTLVVELARPTATEARDAAARVATDVLAALRAAGVAEPDARTAGLDVQPHFEPDARGMHRRSGFAVVHRIAALVRDVDAVGRVLDAALDAGATGVEGVDLRLADPAAAEHEARELAVADARARATTIAEAAGHRLGALLEIGEGGAGGEPRPMARTARFAMAAEAAATPVAAGRLDVTVAVMATWRLEAS